MFAFDTYIDLPSEVKGNVVVIGNFDGVHKGHQALLSRAQSVALESGVKIVVLTFDPHPRQFFDPDGGPFRLTNTVLKNDDLKSHGADYVITLAFDKTLSTKTATDFIQDVLVDGLNAHHIIVGDDFIFGHQRGGNIETLKADTRFDVTAEPQVLTDQDVRYGSSHIRQALRDGDMDGVRDHLGRYWTSAGIVIHGDKRGREIGYPTANMRMDSCGDFIIPSYGIYAVRAKTDNGEWIDGVANFGTRPMFKIDTPLLEVHLFDFDGDLYDQILTVEWVARLRGEMKFDSLDELIVQMDQDSLTAKQILKT